MEEDKDQRQAIIHTIGCDVDDRLEAFTGARHQAAGAESALRKVSAKLARLMLEVDAVVDKGKMDLDEASLAKRWLNRAVAVAAEETREASKNQIHAAGGVAALQHVIRMLRARENPESVVAPPDDKHPGGSIKAQRQAEDKDKDKDVKPKSKKRAKKKASKNASNAR